MYSSVDTIWVLLGSVLVFFMQAGFAMVETGLTRAKNAGNIVMKNMMDLSIGTVVFWIIGFGLMFGKDIGGFIGTPDFFVLGDYSAKNSYPTSSYFIFQTVFCATAATIVSGAMAERTKFIAYCIYSAIISLVIYPISGHWIWGGGWLATMGFHDFAGSTAVHFVGGTAALIGAKILGPRLGKYDKNGKINAIPGHSLTLAALGVFILWFAWFGFNGCSTVSATGDKTLITMGDIFVNTNMAAAAASNATMIFTWFRYGKPDVSMTLNGALAGLVAVTAGCDVVTTAGACFIGIIAGIAVVLVVEFVDKVLKIDDPVGASGVHCACGALGTILTGFFAKEGGLFYGGGSKLLFTQIIGVASVALWVIVTMYICFKIIDATVGLRVSENEEIAGLDMEEHGLLSSYADFMPVLESANLTTRHDGSVGQSAFVEAERANVLIEDKREETLANSTGKPKFTKVVIITSQNRFEKLKNALDKIGITGLTAVKVLGYGIQKGSTEMYRGVEMESHLLPKVKVEMVISKLPVDQVVNVAKKVLYTGHYGDGKIFIYDVENVIKIRTGEEGYAALQDYPIV